jgi:sugar-specific transcriptional regulator TrmB
MLAELLNENAYHFYDRLLVAGGCPAADIADHETPLLEDLLARRLVFRTAGPAPRFCAVPPMTAVLRLLDGEQQEVLRAQRRLIERYSALESLERRIPAGAGGVEVVDDAEIVAHDLVDRARSRCLLIQGSHLGPPEALTPAAAVRHRRMIDMSLLSDPAARAAAEGVTAGGAEVRVLPQAPTPMLVTDAAALVRMGPPPTSTVLLIRGGDLVESLARLFDLLWAGAVPLTGERPVDGPSAVQLRILRLSAAGLKDEAIARALGRSVRWVRRHFEVLEELLGATNRMTLGIAASRRNWV